jgi:hypothetical protein
VPFGVNVPEIEPQIFEVPRRFVPLGNIAISRCPIYFLSSHTDGLWIRAHRCAGEFLTSPSIRGKCLVTSANYGVPSLSLSIKGKRVGSVLKA